MTHSFSSAKALKQAVKRNSERFPDELVFQFILTEKNEVVTNCDHLAKLSPLKNRSYNRKPVTALGRLGYAQ